MVSVITVCAVAQLIVISLQQVTAQTSILPLTYETLTSGKITVYVPNTCQIKNITQPRQAGKCVWTLDCQDTSYVKLEVINPTNPTNPPRSISVTCYDKDGFVANEHGNDEYHFFFKECSVNQCNSNREEIKIENESNNKVKITFKNNECTFPVSHCSGGGATVTPSCSLLISRISIPVTTEMPTTPRPLTLFPPGGITVTVPQFCQNWLITQPCPSDRLVWKLNCTNNTNQVTVVVMNRTKYESDSVTLYGTDSLVLSLETEGGCVLESTGRCVCVKNNKKQDPTACNEHGEQINIIIQDDETVKITFNETDYMLDDGSSLNFNQGPINWIDALKWCKDRGASLVELTEPTTKHGVKCLLKKQPDLKTGVWIGLERSIIGTNDDWQWISGSKDQISPWNRSFPVNRYNNHCGQLVWNNQTEVIKYLDGHCHKNQLPFICQERS
ncbi:uncharacterized protein LOC114444986 [Parambassis ranga]|uniref:Uncharacterized protein LOC114444986 n=1 Tax=Parambassis ranga TaxID=210632 RepID=A0A6P7JG72_9TELE|nr:uncharacterized protein LOC114444986 [Parambassis ranga]